MPYFYPVERLSPFKAPIIRILVIASFLFFSSRSFGQLSSYTRSYIDNVVEIGLSDFGLITAQDSANIYFIAVRKSQFEKNSMPEKISNTIKTAKFYGGAYQAKATKVTTAQFGGFTVVLYKAPKPADDKWTRNYYFSITYKKGKLTTFRDKWLSDKIWATMDSKLKIIKQPKAGVGVGTLEIPIEAGIAKGMPLVNNDGFVAGIFAEASLGKKSVKIIDMKAIADALYTAAGNTCSYFQMIEWNQTDVRCILEQQAQVAAAEQALLDAETKATKNTAKQNKKAKQPATDTAVAIVTGEKPEPKQHFLDYGLNANILVDPQMTDNPNKDNDFSIRAYHLGLSLHLNIDKKKGNNRITLKPRYGNFSERNDDGLWTSPDEEIRIVRTTYQYVEMPVVFERRLFGNGRYSVALGAGYSAGWVFNHSYHWIDKAVTSMTKQQLTNTNTAIMQRFIGELHFYEFKFGRLTAVYTKDLSAYPHADYKVTSGGADYTPFADKKKNWYVGLEFGIRLRGSWLR